jgi:hypothetical protein
MLTAGREQTDGAGPAQQGTAIELGLAEYVSHSISSVLTGRTLP